MVLVEQDVGGCETDILMLPLGKIAYEFAIFLTSVEFDP